MDDAADKTASGLPSGREALLRAAARMLAAGCKAVLEQGRLQVQDDACMDGPIAEFTAAVDHVLSTVGTPADRKLEEHARVGGTIFRAGVPERMVIRMAQRHYASTEAQLSRTPEQRMADEWDRRAVWDLFNGGLTPSQGAAACTKAVPLSDAVVREKARLHVQSGRSWRWYWGEDTELAAKVVELGFKAGFRDAERAHGIVVSHTP